METITNPIGLRLSLSLYHRYLYEYVGPLHANSTGNINSTSAITFIVLVTDCSLAC